MIRPVTFTGDIFRIQPRGGITRYFAEILPRLTRPADVVLGWHQSEEASRLRARTRAGLRLPAVRGVHRLAAPVNAWIDRWCLPRSAGHILHPTYYRDPGGLPAKNPLVVTVHDMVHERFPAMYPLRGDAGPEPERHKAALCRRAELLLCDSHATARDVVEWLGIPESRLRIVHLAGRDFAAIPQEPIAGLDGPFLLWVGIRDAHKNFLPTVRAWASSTEAAHTSLLCVGGGPLREHERAELGALGVASRVTQRTCSDGELHWAYARAEGLLYTSLWEGFGLPLLEAMALGCPVVTSDRSSLPEVGGDAVVYVDPTDVDSLRDGIARCLREGRSAERVATLRAQAARFSWDRTAASVEAAYRELD